MEQRATAFVQALAGKFSGRKAEVLFNPAEYSLEKGNQFASTPLPGLSNPVLSFVNGDADVLTMELFFDTYTLKGGSDVRDETVKISRLLEIDPELHAPPPVRFAWGPLTFRAIIERLTQRFTMFREDGVPVRATLNVTFKEYKTVLEQLDKDPFQSSDWSKWRVVAEGDRLSLMAAIEYGDPAVWRVIADANDIENPRLIEPGLQLRLPPLEGRS
jgi:nucleoid-associated protein YgaU